MKNWKILIGALLIIGIAAFWFASVKGIKSSAVERSPTGLMSAQTVVLDGTEITVYRSPNCGCCSGYIQYLKDNGLNVKTVEKADLDPIKKQYTIPDDMLSCHTSVIGKYFVEGHVPIEAVKRLIAEQPDVDGIALPGMPAGSAGMHGVKSESFVVYAIKNGQASEFMQV